MYHCMSTQRTAAHCRLFGWVAGEGQRAAGVTGQGRGGIVRADAIRVG
jgi:hypothetical protein